MSYIQLPKTGGSTWATYDFGYADFTSVISQRSLTVVTIDPKVIVKSAVIRCLTRFVSSEGGALTFRVGYNPNLGEILTASGTDFTTVGITGDTVFTSGGMLKPLGWENTVDLLITANLTDDATLAGLTDGALRLYVETAPLGG